MSDSDSRFVDFKVVKESVTMVQILEHYGLMSKLRRIGADGLTGPCPIHNGENKTQFRVSMSKNCWNCFSKCQCGGNILDFVSKKESITVRQAALRIAEWFNVQFDRESRPKAQASKPEQQTVAPPESKPQVVSPVPSEQEDATITLNRPLLFSLQHLEGTHPYLTERGFSQETVSIFGMGFCKKGVMANHVAIPIHNGNGQLVAYAGRFPGEPPVDTPKYKLPKGFRKSLEVFNLHRALQVNTEKPLVIVEGFFGCMKLYQAGIHRVVSLMGCSVSEAQEAAILKVVDNDRKIALMFDEDNAGREGREQALKRFASKAYVKVIELGQDGLQPDKMSTEEIKSLLLQETPPPYGASIARFRLGHLVATPNALAHLTQPDITVAIGRHMRGDWGELDADDKQANDLALTQGTRLFSAYIAQNGTKFWIITEADRSSTTILLPEDY